MGGLEVIIIFVFVPTPTQIDINQLLEQIGNFKKNGIFFKPIDVEILFTALADFL